MTCTMAATRMKIIISRQSMRSKKDFKFMSIPRGV